MSDDFKYPGNELELFRHATHWKKYFSRAIQPYLGKKVLEAGAGIGGTTLLLNKGTATTWLLLEPDASMSKVLAEKLAVGELPSNCRVQTGKIDNLTEQFDSIIYIDVLEHIDADADELNKAGSRLAPGGHLIVLSPAFQFLYSPFDKAIGHYRRYSKKRIKHITPPELELISNRYYDSTGYFASLVNKLLLRKKYPTQKEVALWDNWMVPVSTITDKLVFRSFGKSIIAVWKKS